MTGPRRFLLRMVIFLTAVLVVAGFLAPQIISAFNTNPWLNGMILGVLVFGIIFVIRQVVMIGPEVSWLEAYRRGQAASSNPPKLLASMATMLGERRGRLSLSALATRSILDGIQARLDESQEISRYLIGLLVFLGLLGTFWGLLQTVASVGEAVGALSIGATDVTQLFSQLKVSLEQPLSGMGTAFSSSLFGLSGSLVLGFLELQAGQANNRFFQDLEDWLSGVTRLSGGGPIGEGDQPIPAYIQALLEQTADSLENLQRTLARGEEGRMQANSNLLALTERLTAMSDQMRTNQSLMVKLAESQMELRPTLARFVDMAGDGVGGLDEASRTHIRNIDVYLQRLLDEIGQGRQQSTQEIRSEIKLLARTIAALAEETDVR
ncbi:MAG TPA: flagellar motor protein MotA [Alphaproteobacteria bacterium]|nr:flagellar motor protein MotA [Alphaproteobacteria bacterium]